MRALVIDPYRCDVYEKDIPNSLEGAQSVVHGLIEYAAQFPNRDILYVNEEAEFHFDARFGLGTEATIAGFGVVVGALGPDNAQGPALTSRDELRSQVQFFIPINGIADTKFPVGKATNLVVPGKGPDGGAAIVLGGHIAPQSMMIVYEMPNPSLAEIDTIQTGMVEAAVSREGSAAILTWRVTRPSDGRSIWFETPFHMGLQEAGTRYLLPRETAHHGRLLTLVLQDQNSVCRAIRKCVLAPEVSRAMEDAVIEQVVDAARDPAFKADYDSALQRYLARTPNPKCGFEKAPVKGQAQVASRKIAGKIGWIVDLTTENQPS
jgi:hypothetical protein